MREGEKIAYNDHFGAFAVFVEAQFEVCFGCALVHS